MAQGTSRAPDVISEDQGEAVKDYAADVLKVALCSDTFAACAAFTNFSQFTEVDTTGAIYNTPGGAISNSTWVRTGAATNLDMADVGWTQDATGPTNIAVAVVYDSTVLGSDDVITVIDMTNDGTTPVSLVAGALNVNLSFASSGNYVLIAEKV